MAVEQSARRKWAAHLVDPRANPYDAPPVELITSSEVSALLLRAADNTHFDLLISRRRLLSVGADGKADKAYGSAVSDVRAVLDTGAEIRSRLRTAATERRIHESGDPIEIAEEMRGTASALLKSTDGSERERLIRALTDLRRRKQDLRFAASAARSRTVTDLDAAGLRSEIKNLRSLAKRRFTEGYSDSENDDDYDYEAEGRDGGEDRDDRADRGAAAAAATEGDNEDDNFDRSQMLHDGSDPLRWYD
jgi:hypothetical protein